MENLGIEKKVNAIITSTEASKQFKLIIILRDLYFKSRVDKSDIEQRIVFESIEYICKDFSINSDIIIMDEEAFREFSIPVIELIINS